MQSSIDGERGSIRVDFQRPVRFAESLFAQEIDGELVLLDMRDESYYGLDPVAAEIWRRLREGRTPEELSRELTELYEVDEATVRRDLERFLLELFRQRLAWQESAEGSLTSPE